MRFTLHIQGDRACFKRVEFVEDLISYDVITPMAVRGIFSGIYAAPDIDWRVIEIRVLRPIRFSWMSLVEIEGEAPGALLPILGRQRDHRMANVLTDVAYAITAEIALSRKAAQGDPVTYHATQFRERISETRFVRAPYLGLRGFPADIALIRSDDPLPESRLPAGDVDLGWMLYDVPTGGSFGPRLFRPTMIDGVIDLRLQEALVLAG